MEEEIKDKPIPIKNFIIKIICETCGRKTDLLITYGQIYTWKNVWTCSCGARIYKFDNEKKVWYCKSYTTK